ncbi:probable Kinesin-like protein KIF22 at N-terminal half [Coccomyxa sp. Obi]|nr:probable Kinesin-like protein KIF22 at N-terminal half [Coccomyxa sp. Obi]
MEGENEEQGSDFPVSEAMDDIVDPVEHEHRMSELFPRNLGSFFSKIIRDKGMENTDGPRVAVAGTQSAQELDMERMKVLVRIRPTRSKNVPWSKENCIHALSTCSLAMAPPEESQGYKNGDRGQTYNFSRVFGEDTAQEQFFQASAQPMVRQLMQKQISSVMIAYGISAAGKTYTIEGTKAHPGVLPLSLEMVFEEVKASAQPLSVRVSHYEVYNENIFDLLDEPAPGALGPRPALKLKEDSKGRVFVAGLSEVEVGTVEQAMEILRRSSRARQKAATALNYGSSRSHSIFSLAVFGPPDANDAASDAGEGPFAGAQFALTGGGGGGLAADAGLWGRLSFVDLAGSERAARTGNVGARLKESVAINSSLMTLGRCLEALRWNQQHRTSEPRLVPYRESKARPPLLAPISHVTHLFRDVLHGWGQILLCVNVSPAACDYDETARVLRYAALATQIGTAARAEPPLRVLKAKSPNITKKRKAAAEPQPGAKRRAPGGAAAAGDDITHRDDDNDDSADVSDDEGDDASSDALPLASAAAARPRRSSYSRVDADRLEKLEDTVLELQAEVADLTQQLKEAEQQRVLVEMEVREEVSNEMADLLRSMEASYQARLAAETLKIEKQFAREAKQPAERGRCRGAQQGLEEQIVQLQAQLKEAQARESQRLTSFESSLTHYEEFTATQRERMEGLEAQLQQAKQELANEQEANERMHAQLAVETDKYKVLEEEAEKLREAASAAERKQEFGAKLLEAAEAARNDEFHARCKLEEAKTKHAEAEAELRQQLREEMQEKIVQLEANNTMEREMLEGQLERARKDIVALKRKLDSRPPPALHPAVLRAAQDGSGSAMKGGRGAAGTPHDIALARARAEAGSAATMGGTAVSRAAAPAASPVAFPAMSPITVAPNAASARGCAAATGTSHALCDVAAVGSEEDPVQLRTIQQAMVCSHPGPSGLAVAAAASMAMPAEVCEPVQASRRSRRQTMARSQPAAPDLAPVAAAGVAVPDLAPPPAAGRAAVVLAPVAATLEAAPEEGSAAAYLAAVEGEPVQAQEMPRRTRRQTMASGALVQQIPAKPGGAAAVGPKRKRRQTQAGLCAPCIAGMPPVRDGVRDGAMPCISEEEVVADAAVPAVPAHSPQVPHDSEAQLPAAGVPVPGALGVQLCGGAQPGAAAVPRRTRRQTMAALAKPMHLGPSLLSSAPDVGLLRSGHLQTAQLPPVQEEATLQLPTGPPAASSIPAALPRALQAETRIDQAQAQPPPCCSSRRRTIAPTAVPAVAMPPSEKCREQRQQGKEHKAACVQEMAGDESWKPEVSQDVGTDMASGMHSSTIAAAADNAGPAHNQEGAAQPTGGKGKRAQQPLQLKQERAGKRQKSMGKKTAANCARPVSASNKENAPAAPSRPLSGRRKGKRKLLPQKKAAAHTVEAFGELSIMEGLPLRALATPVAFRTRRNRQNKS